MHGNLQRRAETARETVRSPDRADEQMFGSCLADVARLLWPSKTAAHVAALVGCSERAAEFWLAGQREWSGDAIAAIVSEILRRHSMRNVKIVPKRE
jgi:hypothetical protein